MSETPKISLYNQDNDSPCLAYDIQYDMVYADCIYESTDFNWVYNAMSLVKIGGVLIVQSDWHTIASYKVLLDDQVELCFVNWLVWKNEWGNFRKDRLHQVHDDILIYSRGDTHKFYPERIQVNKVTKNAGLNPSGRETKTATSWIDDICLTTTSKERVKLPDGSLVKWQKPESLMERLLLPFTDEGNFVLDYFMGTGTMGVVCKKNNRNYAGIENNSVIFNLASERIDAV